MGRGIVLVVEADDALRRRLLDFLGEELGLAVASARDGREALDRAVRLRPDAVLLGRPADADRAELARRLRRDPAAGRSRIVGAVREPRPGAGRGEPPAALLELAELGRAIARALPRRRPTSRPAPDAPSAVSAPARRRRRSEPAPGRLVRSRLGPSACRGVARRPTRHP